MKKEKKKDYSCIEKHCRGFENPVAKFKRYKRNITHAYQRIKYGYCDSDVWSIDWWFLSLMPNMLEDLRRTTHGYPCEMTSVDTNIQAVVTDEEKEKEVIEHWDKILAEMAFLFREAHEETCSKANPYEEEYLKAHENFAKQYGDWGEKLKTPEEIEEEKTKHVYVMHTLGDVPEYKEVLDKYIEAEKEIDKYRDECKDKGLKMFGEWFWNLWD